MTDVLLQWDAEQRGPVRYVFTLYRPGKGLVLPLLVGAVAFRTGGHRQPVLDQSIEDSPPSIPGVNASPASPL